MIQYIDSHAHLSQNMEKAEILLERAQQAGIKAIVNISTDTKTLDNGLKLSKTYPWIYQVAATPPHSAKEEGESAFPHFERHARQGSLVAVGETGLDYHYYHDTKEQQKKSLCRYLHLALECSLPVVIHCRDAFADFFAILDAEYGSDRGVLHCFTGNTDEARQLLDRGWFLSFSGIVTFKKSEELREIATFVPLDRLLIETDTPYLAPQSHRGKPNEPSFLPEIAQTIATVKNVSLEEVAKATFKNACHFFQLNDLV